MHKCIGSAASLEDLEKLMLKKLYWSEVFFKPTDKANVWEVHHNNGISAFIVRKKQNRYRLEWAKES